MCTRESDSEVLGSAAASATPSCGNVSVSEARPLLRSSLKFHQDPTSWCFRGSEVSHSPTVGTFRWIHCVRNPGVGGEGRWTWLTCGVQGDSSPHPDHRPLAAATGQGHCFHLIQRKKGEHSSPKAFLLPLCVPELSLHFQRRFFSLNSLSTIQV